MHPRERRAIIEEKLPELWTQIRAQLKSIAGQHKSLRDSSRAAGPFIVEKGQLSLVVGPDGQSDKIVAEWRGTDAPKKREYELKVDEVSEELTVRDHTPETLALEVLAPFFP